jgi:hypothetical protein
MKVTTKRLATQEEERAIQQANDILATVNLELIGTRPKRDR